MSDLLNELRELKGVCLQCGGPCRIDAVYGYGPDADGRPGRSPFCSQRCVTLAISEEGVAAGEERSGDRLIPFATGQDTGSVNPEMPVSASESGSPLLHPHALQTSARPHHDRGLVLEHVAGIPDETAQRCARCGALLIDRSGEITVDGMRSRFFEVGVFVEEGTGYLVAIASREPEGRRGRICVEVPAISFGPDPIAQLRRALRVLGRHVDRAQLVEVQLKLEAALLQSWENGRAAQFDPERDHWATWCEDEAEDSSRLADSIEHRFGGADLAQKHRARAAANRAIARALRSGSS